MVDDLYIYVTTLFKEIQMFFVIFFFSDRFCKGVYAISVSGRLPANVIREMKSRGIVYRPRDTSQR